MLALLQYPDAIDGAVTAIRAAATGSSSTGKNGMSNAQKEEDVFMEVEDVLNGEEFQEVYTVAIKCTVLNHFSSDTAIQALLNCSIGA
jgi:hypothetical protein